MTGTSRAMPASCRPAPMQGSTISTIPAQARADHRGGVLVARTAEAVHARRCRQGTARDRGSAPDRYDFRSRARAQRPPGRAATGSSDGCTLPPRCLRSCTDGRERSKLSRHAEVAKAMDYMLRRWERSPASWTMGGSRPTTPASVRCAALRWGGRLGCSRDRIAAAGGGDVFADRHRQAERRRPARLAR